MHSVRKIAVTNYVKVVGIAAAVLQTSVQCRGILCLVFHKY